MAVTKQAKSDRPKPTNDTPPARGDHQHDPGRDDLRALIERMVEEQLAARPAAAAPTTAGGKGLKAGPRAAAVEPAVQVRVYEDDPFREAIAGRDPVPAEPVPADQPANDHDLLQTAIRGAQPDPDLYEPGTREFLFWNATAALARGVNFWAPLLPAGTHWSTFQEPMPVDLDGGVDLNAFYSRPDGLVFFHDTVEGNVVFSVESADVVCHELGHAVLDALKPELFDAASLEVAAFHEAFGDISGMLSALQQPAVREFVLEQTDGDLALNSRLSQLARELGWAIRTFAPTAVEVDCLRNAANAFFYRDPADLPPTAPASALSSGPHSFGRVFTGAFLDALAAMFEVGPDAPVGGDAEALGAVAVDAGRLLVEGIRVAPVGSGYYSQVAAGMVQADQALSDGRYRAALTSSFVRRGVLAPESAVTLCRDLRDGGGAAFGVAAAGRGRHLRFDGDNEGFKKTAQDAPALPVRPLATRFGVTIHAHLPAEPKRFGVVSASVGGGAERSRSAEEDARSFVEDLIQQGRIDTRDAPGAIPDELLPPGDPYPADLTHRLVEEDGKVVLKRRHFDCGLCRRHRPQR